MKLLTNSGNDRVVDILRSKLPHSETLDLASPDLSLFAFNHLADNLLRLKGCRIATTKSAASPSVLLGSVAERAFRNQLNSPAIARRLLAWLNASCAVRYVDLLPQSLVSLRAPTQAFTVHGQCPFNLSGLGLTPQDKFSIIQAADDPDEAKSISAWFDAVWASIPEGGSEPSLQSALSAIASEKSPSHIYYQTLLHLFRELGEELDEDKIVKASTGIRDSVVWRKLFKFQRDGVVGAIDKLERFGGCIIADSVGLGKTFEALAVIKYYELRNDRLLVLCPKRLRDNWTLYKSNDRRNILAPDRLHYDVLNHTDLSRDGGISGDLDLSHINWGNYDLVVIDESHNFRNKPTHKNRDSRYDRLMNRIIKSGVKTRVLMLSATPVNNRLADLKNQIAFVTEGNDTALSAHNVNSIDATTRLAQTQFNAWLKLDEAERTPQQLIEMLGFDYFKLLDLLTIARSRKHIEKYYGTAETGKFPERLRPRNEYVDVDRAGKFRSIREINNEIRRLNLGAYAPLKYVLPAKRPAYDEKYSTRVKDGSQTFKQIDREESLIHLLRVNILKRMESAVTSFALTLERQLNDVTSIIAQLSNHNPDVEPVDIDDIDIDDPMFETLLVGRNVKVLVQDVDRVRWLQDLEEDKRRLEDLLAAAKDIRPSRDQKLERLKELITEKVQTPINAGNRKVIVFTAFADTAGYLFDQIAAWAVKSHGMHVALVTGAGSNRTTVPMLKTDLGSILTAFSPRSKGRPADLASDGDIDILIATDCISEGQNLQDCDYLVNYDIHWNPVRIIQRFGRIDRIGSPNSQIQLVNFWPNIELEEYINLEQRVSGRMVLLDISATGEENVIASDDPARMNDLEYRRKQLMQLQDTVVDLEDLSNGLSISDLTLNDFRVDLASYLKTNPPPLDLVPFGSYGAVPVRSFGTMAIEPGVIFCLRAAGDAAIKAIEPGYPLAPHYLVHVGADGAVVLPYTHAKQILDRFKRLCAGRDQPDQTALRSFLRGTKGGDDMTGTRRLLAAAVASITGKKEERAVASLFSPGGTHAQKGEFAGIDDFEVVSFLAIVPDNQEAAA